MQYFALNIFIIEMKSEERFRYFMLCWYICFKNNYVIEISEIKLACIWYELFATWEHFHKLKVKDKFNKRNYVLHIFLLGRFTRHNHWYRKLKSCGATAPEARIYLTTIWFIFFLNKLDKLDESTKIMNIFRNYRIKVSIFIFYKRKIL